MDTSGTQDDCGLQEERQSVILERSVSCVMEDSVNTADISSNSCDHLETPKKKLSMNSPSSLSTSSSNDHSRPADDSGFRFKCEDIVVEDSPYLQYRRSQCIRSDSGTQKTNERSPTKLTKFGRNGQQSACKSLMKSAFTTNQLQCADEEKHGNASPLTRQLARTLDKAERSKDSELCCGLRQVPGCSPLLLSPVENTSKDVVSSEVNLHFDRMLLRPSTIPTSNEVNFKNDLECQEKSSSPFHPDPQFTFSSSTPLHSRTVAFCTPTQFQEPITVRTDSAVCLRLHFSPESTDPGPTNSETGYNYPERGRNYFAWEQASRNLFRSDDSSLSNRNNPDAGSPLSICSLESSSSAPLLSPLTKDSPSSGFASMTSSDSNRNSSVSSDSKEPLMGNSEKKEFEESESEAEDKEISTRPPERDEFLDIESNYLLDSDGSVGEEMIGPLHWNLEQSFIGDFTKPYALPLVRSSHPDLKGISPNTMAKVIAGHYNNVIDNFIIVDCRYPYEFSGGHIAGAKNIFCHEEIANEFFPNSRPENLTEERTILIFHCEFSSERAPKLSRFLRSKDRDLNRASYPELLYPEIYILEGGYRAFFEQHLELCQPQSYVSMSDRCHGDDMKKFRARTRFFEEERGKKVLKKCCSSTKQP